MRVSRFSARFSFLIAAALIVSLLVVSCGGGNATDPTTTTQAEVADTVSPTTTSAPVSTTTARETTTEVVSDATDSFAGVVDIGGRGLYLRCAGSGSPTVIMEGGDEDTSHSYAFAGTSISAVTRTCVYDRANLGQSDPAEGPRGLSELVGDLEALLETAEVEEPYVLVGTSGGGYITAGYAFAHPDEVAGMVFVETPSPFIDPPPEIVELTAWDHPSNVENRDYLQVEKDAWAARTEIGDIPVTVISNDYGPDAEPGARTNVEDQKGWLVLSPSAKQIVVTTGHAVEEADPQLVIDAILDVVAAAN
jgi:alpha/beta hydrolase fold